MSDATVAVGMNLASTNYWASEFPFINRVKDSGGWIYTYKTGGSAFADRTADGYIDKLPSDVSAASFRFQADPVALEMTDRYVLTYDGTASIAISGATIISSEAGKIVFELSADTGTTVKATGIDHLSNMAIVRADQVDLYDNGQIFNPEFVDKISPFSTLRFMEWGATNRSTVEHWSDRSTLDDRTWQQSEGGVPIEAMVQLANQTHSNMWFNVPFRADDDYVTQALTYIRDNLDPDLTAKIEFSNEVWNTAFSQSREASALADAKWGIDANNDGTINPNDPAEHVAGGSMIYYGYRAAQIASMANTIFADADSPTLEMVLASRNSQQAGAIQTGVDKAGVGTLTSLFDTYAINGYFGLFGSGSTADNNKLLSWSRQGDAGVDAAFRQLESGGLLSTDGSVDAKIASFQTSAADIAALGLKLDMYEGGAAMTANRFADSYQDQIDRFYQRLMDDPRMGALYAKLYDGMAAAGGSEMVFFHDAGEASPNGVWGALSSIYQDHSIRYDTLVSLANGEGTPSWILGNDYDETLYGSSGNDKLDAGLGNDIMIGGLGDDIYVVDSSRDRIVERNNEGLDTVLTALAAYTLPSYVENLTYLGTSNFRATGNTLANTLTGGAGNDVLNGGTGNDTLIGNAGNDTFSDTGGADTMIGGLGNDTYYIDHVRDVVVENPGEGIDQIYASVSYSLAAGVEVERMIAMGTAAINLTGNELADDLRGNDAANILDGREGNDALRGGGGDDLLKGGDGDDMIYGGIGDDVIVGGAGRDTLRGDAGADTFVFMKVTDLGKTAATSDTITDLEALDHIDLSAIDANMRTTGNDAFVFIGGSGFSNTAGELRVEGGSGRWTVMGDVNGDGVADFVLSVMSTAAPTANNFIL